MGVKKKINPKALDGHLHEWLRHLRFVQKLIRANILHDYDDLSFMESSIKRMIIAARAEGQNWLWVPEDIYQDDDFSKDKKNEFRLPSVDIANYFSLDNHNQLEAFFKKNGCKIPIDWDTESSAWYPRCASRKDAEGCIKFVNELFDKSYKVPKS